MSDSIPQSVTVEDLRRGGHEPIPENLPVDLDPARIAEIIGDELAGGGVPFQVIPSGFVIINTDGQGVGRIGNDGSMKIFPQFAGADDAQTFVKIGRIVWRAVQAAQWQENHFKEAAARYAASQAGGTAVSPPEQQPQDTADNSDWMTRPRWRKTPDGRLVRVGVYDQATGSVWLPQDTAVPSPSSPTPKSSITSFEDVSGKALAVMEVSPQTTPGRGIVMDVTVKNVAQIVKETITRQGLLWRQQEHDSMVTIEAGTAAGISEEFTLIPFVDGVEIEHEFTELATAVLNALQAWDMMRHGKRLEPTLHTQETAVPSPEQPGVNIELLASLFPQEDSETLEELFTIYDLWEVKRLNWERQIIAQITFSESTAKRRRRMLKEKGLIKRGRARK